MQKYTIIFKTFGNGIFNDTISMVSIKAKNKKEAEKRAKILWLDQDKNCVYYIEKKN